MSVPSGSREFGSGMDPRRLFSCSPLRNRHPPNTVDGYLEMSPLKTEPVTFSPFKESNLSPFKLIGQSPSKGSYDEWDKDFINSFEENLFGIGDSPEGLTEELLKSPKGKALLNRMSSPLRPSNNSTVSKIRISPLRRQTSSGFHQLSTGFTIGNGIGQELIQVVKSEEVQDDHLYGQPAGSTDAWCTVETNVASATDTPMKPILTSVENAPNRKLAIETPGHFTQVPVVILQKENYLPQQRVRLQETWPSKERLKYARAQLSMVLNGIVDRELERKRVEKKRKAGLIDPIEEPTTSSNAAHKSTSGKHGSKSKGKVFKKTKKKEKYPEISMALAKPAVSKRVGDTHKRSVSGSRKARKYDPGWLPDDMVEEEDVWTGPLPFDSLGSSGFQGDEDSDEDWSFVFETASGKRLNAKRKKRY